MNFPRHIKVHNTVKLFYGSFSYRICFKVDESQLVSSNVGRGWYGRNNYSNLSKLRTELKKRVINKLPDELECRFRSEHHIVTMYLNDQSIFEDLIRRLGDSVCEISVPANDSHKKVMEENHRIRVRKTLFHNNFRFKVNIKNTWSSRFKDFDKLQDWLKNMDDPEGTRWMPNIPLKKTFDWLDKNGKIDNLRYRWHNYAVYLNDDQDVMMLQLWLNEYYDSAEKAVLISEL